MEKKKKLKMIILLIAIPLWFIFTSGNPGEPSGKLGCIVKKNSNANTDQHVGAFKI